MDADVDVDRRRARVGPERLVRGRAAIRRARHLVPRRVVDVKVVVHGEAVEQRRHCVARRQAQAEEVVLLYLRVRVVEERPRDLVTTPRDRLR